MSRSNKYDTVELTGRIKSGEPTAVALGFFDGVHRGHAQVIEAAVRQGLKNAVVTFSQTPGKKENGQPVPQITCKALKEKIFASMSVDTVVYLDFEKVKDMEPADFIEMLTSIFNVKYISTGFNYRFGKGAAAGVQELEKICTPRGIEVCTVAPVYIGGLPLSSTRIRSLIADGDVKKAAELLGRPFAFYSDVIHGRRLGRTLGIPTINQLLPKTQLLPQFGVYASVAHVDGRMLAAVTNIGVKPTVADNEAPLAETHIIGYDGDLYGAEIQVDIIKFIRPERRFSGLDALREQMKCDSEKAFKIISEMRN